MALDRMGEEKKDPVFTGSGEMRWNCEDLLEVDECANIQNDSVGLGESCKGIQYLLNATSPKMLGVSFALTFTRLSVMPSISS